MLHTIPLNFIQQRFWVDDLLKGQTAEYNDTNFTFEVRGDISLTILREAYRQIMLEYLPFCSTIQVINDVPNFVSDTGFVSPPFTVMEDVDTMRYKSIDELIVSLVNQPFDLQKEFPCRFYCIKWGGVCYLLHLFHHVVMDGITLKLFFDRLSIVYNQLVDGNYSFIDQMDTLKNFNVWLEERYQQSNVVDTIYWKNYIQDTPLHLSFPLAVVSQNADPDVQTVWSFSLGKELAHRVDMLCRQYHTTHFRIYSSVWAFTLAKMLHTDTILLDHTLNLRPRDSFMFGTFVNNLPLKFDFEDNDGDLNFLGILDYSNKNRTEEQRHQWASYSDFLPDNDRQDSQRKSLNVGINYPIEYRHMRLMLAGCQTFAWKHVNVKLSADLVLAIENNEELMCDIRYSSHMSLALVRSLGETFGWILEQVISNPCIDLKRIQLVPPAEHARLIAIEDKNLDLAEKIPQTFLHHFKQSVCVNPTHVAVVWKDGSMTYEELDKRSNALAIELIRMGQTHIHVGLSMPKGPEMLIGILGILKSGNIYVPIDYNYPQNRIDFIIQDSQVNLVLVNHETAVKSFGVSCFCIDTNIGECGKKEIDCLPDVRPCDDAYIIYTSGTTGFPKGIPIKHAMLDQTIVNNIKIQKLDSFSRVMQFANIVFDASIIEIFPVLSVGGTLFLPQEEERKDPVLLLAFLKSYSITVSSIPPVLLSTLPYEHLPYLSTIMIGGDTTTFDAIDFWSRGRLFINSYGPAENSVDATYAILHPDSQMNDIGKSVPGVTCYVLDDNQRIMPDYAVGELYIGGVKLTEGYLNRPELNQEKFIPNPFVSDKDRKLGRNLFLYKSGDLVLRRSDGHLVFIGRSDFQVKLNGYRIELGDIESQIVSYGNGIKDTVVLLHEQDGKKVLVAYLLVPSEENFSVEELKKYLVGCLPAYMIPALIMVLSGFPYNTSGKVDRRKLPLPSFQSKKEEYQAPVTLTEKRLVKIWGQLLKIGFIDRNDSFLSLGGDSIGIIMLSVRIHEVFGLSVKASDIYTHITLSQLADFIDTNLDQDDHFAENELLQIAQSVIGRDDLSVNADLYQAGMDICKEKDFVSRSASEKNLFFTTYDIHRARSIQSLIAQIDRNLYFWTEGKDTGKPILVVFGGFVEYYPYNEPITTYWEKDFSVFFIESYCNFFLNKEHVSLEELFRVYEDLFLVALRGKQIFAITGYCSGAEIAIAFAIYMHERHPEFLFRVLNIEGVYDRWLYNDLLGTINDESLKKRMRTFNELYKNFPSLNYGGPILNVMAGQPANIISPDEGPITDPLLLERYQHAWKDNMECWKRYYPTAPYYELDCNHMNFAEEKNLDALRSILQKHWNI